jgi:hypothetical protein
MSEFTVKMKKNVYRIYTKGPFGSLHFGGIEIYLMD